MDFNFGDIPVLFIPGWLPLIDTFPYTSIYNSQFKNICTGYRYMVFNLSNLYKSAITDQPFTLDDYSDEIAEIIKSFGYEKVNLIGHSAGGRFSIHFTSKYPEMVDKLVLMNSAGLKHKPANQKMLDRVNYFFGKFIVSKNEKEVLKQTFQNVYNEDLTDEIAHISHETMIIWGEKDKTINVSKADRFHELIKFSNLRIFPYDHMTILKPDVYEEIFKFIGKPNEDKSIS